MVEEKAEWHLLRGKEQTGPYPLSKVLEAVAQNILQKTDYVWRQGWPEWKLAGAVPELFADAGPAPQSAAPAVAVDPAHAATVEALHRAAAEPLAAHADKPGGNYFARHWRGDLSLPISFWVNGVLVAIGLSLVIMAFYTWLFLQSGTAGDNISGIVKGIGIAILPLAVWQYVGVSRSASNHVARGGRRFWAFLAKVVVIIGVLYSAWGALRPFLTSMEF